MLDGSLLREQQREKWLKGRAERAGGHVEHVPVFRKRAHSVEREDVRVPEADMLEEYNRMQQAGRVHWQRAD